jgi:hypothetical protein
VLQASGCDAGGIAGMIGYRIARVIPPHEIMRVSTPSNPPVPNDDLPPLPVEPRPGRYRHYKGREYRVLGIARHSETLEALVVYRPLYGAGALWVRPVAMFRETVVPIPGAAPTPRFIFVAAE